MHEFTHETPAGTARELVSDELAPYFRGRYGYTEVLPVVESSPVEAIVESLTGPALDKAVKAAGIPNPSALKADEKREALVAVADPTHHEEK